MIAAAEFRKACFRVLDEVARTRSPVVVTKRGRPVAKLIPYREDLRGSIVRESGNPCSTGESWDADRP